MKYLARLGRLILAVGALVFSTSLSSAPAGSVNYVTPSGSTTTGGSVDASATLTAGAGFVEVTLTNLGQNPTADSQLISALTFNISGATGSGSLTTENSGNITTINSGGTYSAGVADSLTHWHASNSTTAVTLTTLTGGQPFDEIIGPDSLGNFDPSLGGLYSHANSSIINHNPNVLGTATFDIDIAGVTAASTFSDVVFQFGTTAGSNLVDGSLAVPEPSSIVLMLAGLPIGIAAYLRRRKSDL